MDIEAITRAAAIVAAGGVVAYPTEAGFGLGCDPRKSSAIRRILWIKRRPVEQGLILLSDNVRRLLPFVRTWSVAYRQQMLDSWPGPHTWVLPASRRASYWLRGKHHSVALRVTAHREAAKICQLARMPIVSTSANRSGQPMLRSHLAVLQKFGNDIDFIVAGAIGDAQKPSCIRDAISGQVLRA